MRNYLRGYLVRGRRRKQPLGLATKLVLSAAFVVALLR